MLIVNFFYSDLNDRLVLAKSSQVLMSNSHNERIKKLEEKKKQIEARIQKFKA